MKVLTDDDLANLSRKHGPFAFDVYRAIEAETIKRLAAGVRVEPVAYYANHRLTPEGTTEFYGYADKKLEPSTMLYTAEAIAAARVQENERCAQALEALWHSNDDSTKKCIAAIRAMLGKEAQS